MSAPGPFAVGVTAFVVGEVTGINELWPRSSKIASLLIAYPKTRLLGLRISQLIVTETARASWRIGIGILGETWKFTSPGLIRYGRLAGPYAGAVLTGYVVGALGGTAISGILWGDKGAAKADSLYSGEESKKEITHTMKTLAGPDMRLSSGDFARLVYLQLTQGTHESWE